MTRKETTGMAKTSLGSVANVPCRLHSSTANKTPQRWTMEVESCPQSFDLIQLKRLEYLSNSSMRWQLELSCSNGRTLVKANSLRQTLTMIPRAFSTLHVNGNIYLPRMKRSSIPSQLPHSRKVVVEGAEDRDKYRYDERQQALIFVTLGHGHHSKNRTTDNPPTIHLVTPPLSWSSHPNTLYRSRQKQTYLRKLALI